MRACAAAFRSDEAVATHGRECDTHAQAAGVFAVFERKARTVRIRNALDDRQAESGAACTGIGTAAEAVEHRLALPGRDAGPVVRDDEFDDAADGSHGHGNAAVSLLDPWQPATVQEPKRRYAAARR